MKSTHEPLKTAGTGKGTAQGAVTQGREMAAAVFSGPRTIRLERAPRPDPGPEQVRVRLEGCGVCGSNLPVWQGRAWFEYPLAPGAPGHEGWGVVEAIGEGVGDIAPGTRVAALSYRAYAECDIADAANVVALPRELDGMPFPGEPLGCAMNVIRRAAIREGETVAIVGVGFLGALLVRLAALAGARVIALGRRTCALAMAARLGAAETLRLDHHRGIIERVRALTGGAGCDCVIEAVGQQWPLDLAGELVHERGRVVIAGYHQDGLRQVNMQLWNWKGLDVINAHERDPRVYIQGMREAVAALAAGRLDPSPLYSHTFALKDLPQAFAMMEERPEGFYKALVML